jgi:glutamine synthetase
MAAELAEAGVVGVTIARCDNNGIPRSRTVPVEALTDVAALGVAVSPFVAVCDSHDAITYEYAGISTPSGDLRLLPVVEPLTRLAGQPRFAWAPARQVLIDGQPWPYDQRARLEGQVARAAEAGLTLRAGFEIECFVGRDAPEPVPAYGGPAYSPHALLQVDEFAAQVLADLKANGVAVGQFHAEYGPAQLEVSLAPSDPLGAADRQLLARQTIHAAARAHGLRVSFAPLVDAGAVGNGLHLHTSVLRDGQNLLAGDGSGRPAGDGARYLAGLLRDLPAIAAVAAPSVPSLWRRRPGRFAGAYAFWGVENREAPLRYLPTSPLLGRDHANVELKASDASGNPYLVLAAVIAAGLAGIEEGLELAEPIQEDPGNWDDDERARRGVSSLPITPAEQEAALASSERVVRALGEPLLGAFAAVRRSDAAWAAEHTPDQTLAAHWWRY